MPLTQKDQRRNPRAVSIVVPTLNEAENIDPLLTAIFAEAKKHEFDAEVIVVDDGSKDGTVERVRAWEGRHPVRLLQRTATNGLAGAVLDGARLAERGIVVVMDADLSHPPESLVNLIEPVAAGDADMVIGSRYTRGGETPGWPWTRRLASRMASALAWPLTDVRDSLSGFFAVRRETLMDIPAEATGFKIALEVLVRGGETMRVREVPIVFRDRTRGQSKMKFHVIVTYLQRLLAFSGMPVRKMTTTGFLTAAGVLADVAVFLALLGIGAGLGEAQIASFAVASGVNYFLRFRAAVARGEPAAGWRFQKYLAVVLLLALFLRGGVVSLLVTSWGWPPWIAILAAIVVAAMVTLPGVAFCGSSSARRYGSGMRWRMIAMVAIAYTFVLRLLYLGQMELMPEEAYYWQYSQHIDIGYLDHPPMVAWINWLGGALFGRNEFAVRIGATGCWLVAACFVYGLARNLFSKSAGFVAVLFMQVLPFFFSTGLLMTPDASMTACWAGALYFLERVLLGNRAGGWWGVGVCMGLGMLSKYSIGLVGAATLVFILVDRPSRRWLFRWEPYAATLLGIAIFSPVLIWNARTDWASFSFQTTRRLAERPKFSLHALLGCVMALLTPTGFAAAGLALTRARNPAGDAADGEGDFARRRALFMRVFTLVPLAVFAAFSLRHEVKFQWTGPLWLAILPAMAAGLIAAGNSEQTPFAGRVHRAWQPTFVVLLVLYGAGLHYLVLGLPGVGYIAKTHLVPVGWRELARRVDVISEKVRAETGVLPLFTGMERYFTSSECAFYSSDPRASQNRAVGVNLFDAQALMYARWSPKAAQEGRDIVVIAWRRHDLERPQLAFHATRLGPIVEGTLTRNDRTIAPYYTRVVYGYRAAGGE